MLFLSSASAFYNFNQPRLFRASEKPGVVFIKVKAQERSDKTVLKTTNTFDLKKLLSQSFSRSCFEIKSLILVTFLNWKEADFVLGLRSESSL